MAIMGLKQRRVVNDIYVHVYRAELVQAARLMEGIVLPRLVHIGAEVGAKEKERGRDREIAS